MLMLIIQYSRTNRAIIFFVHDRTAKPGAFVIVLKIHIDLPTVFRDAHFMIGKHMMPHKIPKLQLNPKHGLGIFKVLLKRDALGVQA